jgi:hypothetical protein
MMRDALGQTAAKRKGRPEGTALKGWRLQRLKGETC